MMTSWLDIVMRGLLTTVFIPMVLGGPAPTTTPKTPPPALSDAMAFSPAPLGFAADEIANPGRGLYRWTGQTAIADKKLISDRDSYRRFPWFEIETRKGEYDFSKIDAFLDEAEKNGQRAIAGFVQPIGPAADGGSRVPPYLTDAKYGEWWNGTFWPDYNNDYVRERFAAIIAALGQRYGNDERLAMVQMNHYGAYGEYHVPYRAPERVPRITPEHARETIGYFQRAFPNTRLSALVSDSHGGSMTKAALSASPDIGWSRMALGCEHQFDSVDEFMAEPVYGPILRDRWKTAPVWTEMIGWYTEKDCGDLFGSAARQVSQYHISYVSNGNFDQPYDIFPYERDGSRNKGSRWSQKNIDDFVRAGKLAGYRYRIDTVRVGVPQPGTEWQIETVWRNDGNAPTYDGWQVQYELRDRAGKLVWSGVSQVNLRQVLPTDDGAGTQVTDLLALPGDLPGGRYELRVNVPAFSRYVAPLQLAMEGQQRDGSYTLGQVLVP